MQSQNTQEANVLFSLVAVGEFQKWRMKSVPLILLIFCATARPALSKQCGVIATGQGDPFGLMAQLTGNFIPPVPLAPAVPSRRVSPWIPFGRSANTPTAVTDTTANYALQQLMSPFRPGKNLRRIRTRRQIRNMTVESDRLLTRIRRIVGGYDATPGQLCWQVKIQIGSFFDETICGGSIIGSRTILMAAHCLFDENTRKRVSDRRVSVVVGGTNRDVGEPYGMDFTGCAESFTIERSVVNPLYNYNLNDNDIAVLILTRPIDLDRKSCACAICLSKRIPQPSEWCVVSGFGEESNDGRTDRNPVPLKWTQLQIRANDYTGSCAFNSYSGSVMAPGPRTNLDLFVCAGNQPYQDTCQGDSGGPMVCLDPVKKTYYQAGITSFGDDCGAGVGGQYTKVSAYIPWILSIAPTGDLNVFP